MTTEATLLTIIKDGRILLLRKASGRFGEGKWNGVGGKIRPDETPEECAVRETLEETGLRIRNLIVHGIVNHYFGDVSDPTWTVHHYSASEFDGEPNESEEGELRWFPLEKIPYDKMWQDDIYWLPHQIEGKRFQGHFYFNDDASQLIRYTFDIED